MRVTVRNMLAVARREFLARSRTRSFLLGTILLAVAGATLALAPIGIRMLEGAGKDKIGVVDLATGPGLGFDTVDRLAGILNASATGGMGGFEVVASVDEATARTAVQDGKLTAAVVLERVPGPDLAFVIVSRDQGGQRTPELLRQACYSVAIADRLDRLGVAPGDQATLFAAPAVTIEKPTPAKPGESMSGPEAMAAAVAGQVLVLFLLVAIILYGQWVATSAAEEKSSRVVEIVISAATPFQLLGGKVIGVGGLGLVQLLAAALPAAVALALQGRIAEAVFGSPASALELPQALTLGIVVVFVVFFVLGYLLYATLYAAAGSMVSRMEDVNNVVAPMSVVGSLAYIVGAYATIGIIPADALPVVVLSFLPFTSPYVMLSRVIGGQAGAVDVVIAAVLLVVSIVVALWAAARVYSAGILTFGQAPGFRRLLVTAFGRQR